MEKIHFPPKDVQGILSSHKISYKYNEQEVFYKKPALKNVIKFRNIHRKTLALKSLFKLKFGSVSLLKQAPMQALSCEHCLII